MKMVDCSITITLSHEDDIMTRLSKIKELSQGLDNSPPDISAIEVEKTESGCKLRVTYRCNSEEECLPILLLTD